MLAVFILVNIIMLIESLVLGGVINLCLFAFGLTFRITFFQSFVLIFVINVLKAIIKDD